MSAGLLAKGKRLPSHHKGVETSGPRLPVGSAPSEGRKPVALEEFREKLPKKYQSDESVELLLRLRSLVRNGNGMTLSDIRAGASDSLSMMQCSQMLEVLTRLGFVVRETRDRGAGIKYFPAGPSRKK